jgi:CrcB protein
LINVIAVAAGAILGANARYWLGLWISRRLAPAFPFGTLAINLTGSLVIGLLHSMVGSKLGIDGTAELFAITGFLGAYTTYSTFSFEVVTLAREHEPNAAASYVVASMTGGILLAGIGFGLGNWLGRVFW